MGFSTASLIKVHDFDEILKDPFRYVHLFIILKLSKKEKLQNRHA